MSSNRPPILSPSLGLLMMLAVFAIHFIRPVGQIFVYPMNYLGLIPIVLGAALNVLADKEFRLKGVISKSGQYLDNSGILVTSGVYGRMRNPAYVGQILINAGLAIWVGSISPWLVVIIFALVLHYAYILPEEKRLAEAFDRQYRQYCQLVPRWGFKLPSR